MGCWSSNTTHSRISPRLLNCRVLPIGNAYTGLIQPSMMCFELWLDASILHYQTLCLSWKGSHLLNYTGKSYTVFCIPCFGAWTPATHHTFQSTWWDATAAKIGTPNCSSWAATSNCSILSMAALLCIGRAKYGIRSGGKATTDTVTSYQSSVSTQVECSSKDQRGSGLATWRFN